MTFKNLSKRWGKRKGKIFLSRKNFFSKRNFRKRTVLFFNMNKINMKAKDNVVGHKLG